MSLCYKFSKRRSPRVRYGVSKLPWSTTEKRRWAKTVSEVFALIAPGVYGCPCIHEINRRVRIAPYHGPMEGGEAVRLCGSKGATGARSIVEKFRHLFRDSKQQPCNKCSSSSGCSSTIGNATTDGINPSNGIPPLTVRWSTPSPLATYAATSTLTTAVLFSMVAVTSAEQPSACAAVVGVEDMTAARTNKKASKML